MTRRQFPHDERSLPAFSFNLWVPIKLSISAKDSDKKKFNEIIASEKLNKSVVLSNFIFDNLEVPHAEEMIKNFPEIKEAIKNLETKIFNEIRFTRDGTLKNPKMSEFWVENIKEFIKKRI